jgi:hypothetical protein
MVHLTGANSEFAARVLVAKLGSAGILAEVRGISGVYPVLGGAAVWVEAEAADDARELITTDTDDVLPSDEAPVGRYGGRPSTRRRLRPVLVAVAVLLLGSFAVGPRCATSNSVVHNR